MNELQLSTDLNVIATRIKSNKNLIGYSLIEIGKDLNEAKQKETKHGEWLLFLEEVGIQERQAQRMMKVAQELSSNTTTLSDLPFTTLYEIATLPQEEREKEHVTSKGETKTVDEMTVRELQEVKRKLKRSEQAKQQAETQAEIERKERERVERENQELASREPQVIEKVIKDETEINRLTSEINQLKIRLNQESKDAETYRNLRNDIERLSTKRDGIISQINNVGSLGKFIARVEKSFEEDLAPVKYSNAIQELSNSDVAVESLDKIVSKVENWCREIRGVMKDKDIVEVIEYEE